MTRLINDPHEFATESLNGFAAAHTDSVSLVPDSGVARFPLAAELSNTAIVMGGGAGHYPAFIGWVGPGLVNGAVSGNIFSSPSSAQVVRVARAATAGKSILFLPINYSGDILHFSEAREQLIADGYDARMVAITDDIASGPAESAAERRGIAGSFIVAKLVGAAVEAGADIAAAERIAHAANDATRTLGLAFTGCTLPGQPRSNSEIAEGQIALGLGIHGEPGLRMLDLESADHAADVLVDGLFEERAPIEGRRVAVLVNGLGATKYDELNVLFARIKKRIEGAGMTVVAPVVGELVTSLDMAGASLSITYLDDTLEELWLAPAQSVAFTRGASVSGSASAAASASVAPSAAASVSDDAAAEFGPASTESVALAAAAVTSLGVVAGEMATRAGALARLDAVAGDGDHGACMERGSRAALKAAQSAAAQGAGAGSVLIAAGQAWSDIGGGTSGALWGAALSAAGSALGDEKGSSAAVVRELVDTFASTISTRGGAAVGDKTMVDAIVPFASSFATAIDAGNAADQAWHGAADAAREAALSTAGFIAKRGRARTHGDASLGTPDPGAVSFALIVASLDAHSTVSSEDWSL